MSILHTTRREWLGGAAAVTFGLGAPALAKAPMLKTQVPAYYRFMHGDFEMTVVSDGPLPIGEAKPEMFGGATKEDLERTLKQNFLSSENIVLEQNTLLVNTGDKLVLFDTGTGSSKIMGDKAGRLLTNMRAAGVDPKDVDAIVLTHAHPDHCWGLMDAAGARNFPNAQIYIAQSDLEFWTDEAKKSIPFVGGFIDPTRAALLPNRDRIIFVKDGQEILPGIQAMAAPGHTVGHTIYMITSQGKTLCNFADTAHHHVLIVENPKIEFAFDTDPKMGVATRTRVFDMLAAQRIPLLAYHFPWPGIGNVTKRGDGFHYTPVVVQTVL